MTPAEMTALAEFLVSLRPRGQLPARGANETVEKSVTDH
jgi:hypothetical protein